MAIVSLFTLSQDARRQDVNLYISDCFGQFRSDLANPCVDGVRVAFARVKDREPRVLIANFLPTWEDHIDVRLFWHHEALVEVRWFIEPKNLLGVLRGPTSHDLHFDWFKFPTGHAIDQDEVIADFRADLSQLLRHHDGFDKGITRFGWIGKAPFQDAGRDCRNLSQRR